MKVTRHFTIFIVIFFISCFLLSETTLGYNSKLLKRLFIKLEVSSPKTGAIVFNVRDGETLYSLKEHETFVPASVAKLLTSYAALKTLGPDYTFLTRIYTNGDFSNGVLHGDMYIKGYGDPFLVEEKTWIMAQNLLSIGLKHIKGDLVIDGSFFSPMVTKLRIDENENRPYNAIVSALAVDFNTVTFKIYPPTEFERKLRISVLPPTAFVNFMNNLKISKRCLSPGICISKPRAKGLTGEFFVLRGNVPAHGKPFEIRSNVSFPLLFSGYSIRRKLEAVGIKIDGKVKCGKVPGKANLIDEYRSPPLREILYGLNRFSNNFMAEMLIRVIGAEKYGAPATLEKGRKVVEETLKGLGIPSKEYFITNGSGLSRNMRISPFVIRKILESAYKDFSISPEFLASLATPGTVGTLKCRFKSCEESFPRLRAKTGSLNGVITLAGYTTDSKGNVIGLVIFCNDTKNTLKIRDLVDRIVCALKQ